MNIKWNVKVNGVKHEIRYNSTQRKAPIIIDGKARNFNSKVSLINAFYIDEPINIDNNEMHLVITNGKADLAFDGVFLNSAKKYEPSTDKTILKSIFLCACLLPIILIVLLANSTYDLFSLICVCVCTASVALYLLGVPDSKIKGRMALSCIVVILEYLNVLYNLVR